MPNQGSFLSDIETLVEVQGFFCPDKDNSTQMAISVNLRIAILL